VVNVRCLYSQDFIAYLVAPLCVYISYLYKIACQCEWSISLLCDPSYLPSSPTMHMSER
jgi:hypothetical protein